MAASISSSIIACLKSFNEFIENIKHLQRSNGTDIVSGPWEDELGRLRVWAANIGAHQTGQSSLDFRLRDASHIREQIIKLLQGLLRRLQDARDVLVDDEKSDDEEAADCPLDEEDPKTEIQELRESLATNINCLFQMSMLVRKPAQHDVYLGSRYADVAAFEPFDYNHVRDKFPNADEALVKRLGKAITRRRKYLKYRERHATKLRQGISEVDPKACDVNDTQEGETVENSMGSILSDTMATEFEQRNIDFEDKASDTGISQTSYAPTLLVGGNIAIPPPPKNSLGRVPFECPYCFCVITIEGTRSWNKHVFQDLQPYICTVSTCTTPDKLYCTRHEWLDHLKMVHPAAMASDDTLKESRGITVCVLCKGDIELGKTHDRHLARHLQELALFILPGGEEESSVDENQDSESNSDADSVLLAVSHIGSKSPEDQPALIESTQSLHMGRKEEDDENVDNTTAQEKDKEKLMHAETEVEQRRRLLGQEHPDTLQSMTELAKLYLSAIRYQEAGDLGSQVMEIQEKVLGVEHPETLRSVAFIAHIMEIQGHLKEAEQMSQRTLLGYEKTFGRDHPETLVMVIKLGDIYGGQGNFFRAEQMYKRALPRYQTTQGPDASMTLSTLTRLGILYDRQSRLDEAGLMYACALNGYRKTLDPTHMSRFLVTKALVKIYQKQGKLAEAAELSKQIPGSDREGLYISDIEEVI